MSLRRIRLITGVCLVVSSTALWAQDEGMLGVPAAGGDPNESVSPPPMNYQQQQPGMGQDQQELYNDQMQFDQPQETDMASLGMDMGTDMPMADDLGSQTFDSPLDDGSAFASMDDSPFESGFDDFGSGQASQPQGGQPNQQSTQEYNPPDAQVYDQYADQGYQQSEPPPEQNYQDQYQPDSPPPQESEPPPAYEEPPPAYEEPPPPPEIPPPMMDEAPPQYIMPENERY